MEWIPCKNSQLIKCCTIDNILHGARCEHGANFMLTTVARAPYTIHTFFCSVVDVLIYSATEIFIERTRCTQNSCRKRQSEERESEIIQKIACNHHHRPNHTINIQTWTTNWRTKYFGIPAIRRHIYQSNYFEFVVITFFNFFRRRSSFVFRLISVCRKCTLCVSMQQHHFFSRSISLKRKFFVAEELILTGETLC